MEAKNVFTLEYAKAHVDEVIKVIRSEGIIIVRQVFSENECDQVKEKLDKILDKRLKNGHYYGNQGNQVLDNYFLDNQSLLSLIYEDITDQLMKILIDNDYVLISPSARNVRNWNESKSGKTASGSGWHTDSRFLGGVGIQPSLCYMSIVCIDPFKKENGCTHYIPKSHLLYEKPKNRDKEMSHEYLLANKGDLVIFDTALWHRLGVASKKSRWGVFNTYGPWFMKPYHRFLDMFSLKDIQKFDPIIRQLLHYDSHPPKDHNESMITLRRVRNLIENNHN
jgi:hypothetical protein